MSKKRAFIKYTKAGELIPGSLIITTSGGFPKDGVYKEVDVDLCCPPVCPECPIQCTLYRNDGPDLIVMFDALVCGATGMSDIEIDPGLTSPCVQFYNGTSGTGPLTNLGHCIP